MLEGGLFMTLSWEEYQKIVPKETLDFTESLLHYWNNVLSKKIWLRDHNLGKDTIRFLVTVYVAYKKTMDMKRILLDDDFDERFHADIKLRYDTSLSKENYLKCLDCIPSCKSIIEYEQLIPEDFFLYHLENVAKVEIYKNDCKWMKLDVDDLMDKVTVLRDNKKKMYREQLEKKIFENCSHSVVSYFKTASQIAKRFDERTSLLPASLSLFLALYFYKGTEQKVIENILEDKGIGYDEMIKSFTTSLSNYEHWSYDIYQIEHDYSFYLEDKNLSVPHIVEKMATMSFDDSLGIMNFLKKHGLEIEDFKNFNELYEAEKIISQEDCWQEMSFSLQNDVKELLEDSTKIYSYLVDTLENKSTKYLKSKDDADTLALFLASFSNPTTLNQFFENHGVTYDDICHLLKIPVEKDKIIEPSFKEKTLVRRFLRFLISGENKGKDIDKITVFDVVQNLVNRKFNKSFVMESLFYELGDGTRPFEEKYVEYVQNTKLQEEKELRNRLFLGMDSEMITFWEDVSRCYDYFMKENRLNKHGRKFYSIIYAGINVSSLKDFWEWSANGLLSNSEALAKVLKDENMVISVDKNDVNLNLLMNDFREYFKEDCPPLGLIDVLDQAVAEEMELSPYGITIFEPRFNLIKSFRKYYEIFTQEKEMKLGKQIYDAYPIEVQRYLYKVLNTYLNVKEYFDRKDDSCLYSFLYATLDLETEEAHYLMKHNITKELLKEEKFVIEAKDLDYTLLVTDFSKYFLNPKAEQLKKDFQFVNSYCSENTIISSLFQEIFDKEICPSTYLERLCDKVGCDYQILKMEVCSLKDYVLLVSPEERMKMLEETSVEPLIPDNIQSILHFGDSLSIHSSAIHEEYPKLMLNDSSEKAIIELNELMNKVIPKEKSKTFSFRFLFKREEKSEGLNEEGVQELKKAIDENLKILSKELVVLEQLLKYINIYRTKNEEYANRLHLAIVNKEQERTLLEKDDDILKPMQYQSLLQILKDKENRFLTTKNLMNQELLKLYQTITNHFITINALEMAKNDFIPVIYSEFIIGKSRDSENEAIELSRKMMNLLQDVISRNLDGAEQNIEALKNSSLSKDVVEMLNQDITLYIENTKRMSFNESDSSYEQGVKLVLTNEKRE